MFKIKSLDIEYSRQQVITDIDDCLMLTSNSIKEHGIKMKSFYFNNEIYEANKESVIMNAKLTDWGKEFCELINDKKIPNYLLLTSAKNRIDIIARNFNVEYNCIKENLLNKEKITLLNVIIKPSIYIDDKYKVIKRISNNNVKTIWYPKKAFSRKRLSIIINKYN